MRRRHANTSLSPASLPYNFVTAGRMNACAALQLHTTNNCSCGKACSAMYSSSTATVTPSSAPQCVPSNTDNTLKNKHHPFTFGDILQLPYNFSQLPCHFTHVPISWHNTSPSTCLTFLVALH